MNNMRNKILMTLALLITAVTGAWAQTETPLVTIQASENSTFTSGSKTFNDIATVTITGNGYIDVSGWVSCMLTVTPADGVTITSVKFYGTSYVDVVEDTSSPFEAEIKYDSNISRDVTKVNGTKAFDYGVLKIEVFGTAEPEITEWSLTPDTDKKVWTLDKMPANDIELQVEYEPTKVTMAVNDKTMGTVEVGGESKVEWTADTWKGWMSDTKEYTVDDITMTSSQSAYVYEYAQDGDYLHSLYFYVNQTDDNSTVTFSTTGDPFSRIEFTMIKDYKEDELFNNRWNGNPTIMPKDNWTFSGKSAVWEGEATKSLTLQSCSTAVSKITFFKGAIPDGVTINTDGTFTVAKTATVTLKATPAEGYKFLYWEDDHSNTNPVREVTIESGMDDMTYKAVFAEITYNVTFVEGTDLNEWSATPNTAAKNTKVDIKYTGAKKVIGVKVEKKGGAVDPANAYLKWDADQKKLVATEIPAEVTMVQNADQGVTWTAGTYVVEGEVTINGGIILNGNVELIIKDGAKLTANTIDGGGSGKNLSIYGQANQTGQLVVNNSNGDAISGITTLEVHSCQVKATSSNDYSGGFFNITTINVYGGSVDAECTSSADGYGIIMPYNGSINIYGGDVKAVGKGTENGITGGPATVTVYGGKLWAENAANKALGATVTLKKDAGYTSGKIEYSSDKSTWSESEDLSAKYVRVGY